MGIQGEKGQGGQREYLDGSLSYNEYLPFAGIAIPFIILFVGRQVSKRDKIREKIEHDTEEITRFINGNKDKITKLEQRQQEAEDRIRLNERDIARLIGRINGRGST